MRMMIFYFHVYHLDVLIFESSSLFPFFSLYFEKIIIDCCYIIEVKNFET